MKTIESNIQNEYIINKSKFITFLYKVQNINDINKYLEYIKKEYKDATHYCYAYIIDNIERFNDDGEPGGTAGMPILNVLKNNELNYILCIVVRYFGGIKLGTGGLVRAYTKSVTNCIDNTNIIQLVKGYKIKISFNYNNIKAIDNLIKNDKLIYKEFNDSIIYELLIKNIEIIDSLEQISKVISKEEIYI